MHFLRIASRLLPLPVLLVPARVLAHPLGGGPSTLELHDWGHKLPALIAVVGIVVVIDSIFIRLILRSGDADEAETD